MSDGRAAEERHPNKAWGRLPKQAVAQDPKIPLVAYDLGAELEPALQRRGPAEMTFRRSPITGVLAGCSKSAPLAATKDRKSTDAAPRPPQLLAPIFPHPKHNLPSPPATHQRAHSPLTRAHSLAIRIHICSPPWPAHRHSDGPPPREA